MVPQLTRVTTVAKQLAGFPVLVAFVLLRVYGPVAPPEGTLADAVVQPYGPLPLPEAPEKALVLEYCMECHGLEWIGRSGGTEEGWRQRITRMIRGGARIPRDQVPAVAAYLAKALPVRPHGPPDSGEGR